MSKEDKQKTRTSIGKIWLFIINLTITIAFCLFIWSLVMSFFSLKESDLDFSENTLNLLLEMFNNSIKIGAAIIALLTIKVYLSNNNQTERIIEQANRQSQYYIESENLKNYFLHRKEFSLYIREVNFFKKMAQVESFNFDVTWDTLYKTFYDGNYKQFKPKLKKDAKTHINNFLNSIKDSSLNSMELPAFNDVNELEEILDKVIPIIKSFVDNIIEINVFECADNHFSMDFNITKMINKIIVVKQLYESILAFEGENIIQLDTFDRNMNKIFNIKE